MRSPSETVAAPPASGTADQLSLLTDDDLALIDASSDGDGSARPRWYSKLLTCGLLRTLYHRHHGLAAFIAWNLARMGGYRWHDLSLEQIAVELGVTKRAVVRLMAQATEAGDLRRAKEPGHGRRKVTRPGVVVELHPSFYDDAKGDRFGPPRGTGLVTKGDRIGPPSVEVLDRGTGRRSRSTRQAEPPCGDTWGEHHAGLCGCKPREPLSAVKAPRGVLT
ncbi:hypothetical protein [Candidatus Poriferisodalis sp.]|uniref:hypothetical protein n=1 Tax=Candidatus Poriferisodalis sp. TaxID=3101277 RepID=UPI003B017AB9